MHQVRDTADDRSNAGVADDLRLADHLDVDVAGLGSDVAGRIIPGDRVRVELSPYDLTRGRITYRARN